ncbi:DUF2115 domain-containing protein [Methanothermococcus sp. SCGC AD-155-M21]|nr:DUF2115 domain-containing protein [Methanothermococcus sp. SCGC AD-155-M21]
MESRELFNLLKNMAKEFSIYDLMDVRAFLERDMQYLPKDYREPYLKNQIMHFVNVLNEIRKKEECNIENFEIKDINLEKLFNRIEKFKCGIKGEDSFIKLSKIVVPYLIFIAKKPLHPVGTRFPGGKSIVKKNNKYLCPVKNKQKNEYSLCEFCICEGME